jgi:DNA-binding LytR/AlgR family response regulator
MRIGRKDVMFDTRNVRYFEADSMYCTIHFDSGKKRTYARGVAYIQRLITDDSFVRIHRKYLVNRNAIVVVLPTEIHLNNNTILPISRRHKKNIP